MLQETIAEWSKQLKEEGFIAGRAEGKAEGKAEGEARGEARGKAEGKAEGRRAALLAILSARVLGISPELQERIEQCADIATLDRWITRAATAQSAAEALVLDAPPAV